MREAGVDGAVWVVGAGGVSRLDGLLDNGDSSVKKRIRKLAFRFILDPVTGSGLCALAHHSRQIKWWLVYNACKIK